mmetsp:Transcript_46933/g.124170  ORF Transcript_46933/g.124170 Transcript_46933/m.124170 type:complete len:714 (+) Transcript_46933:72-2213(+)
MSPAEVEHPVLQIVGEDKPATPAGGLGGLFASKKPKKAGGLRPGGKPSSQAQSKVSSEANPRLSSSKVSAVSSASTCADDEVVSRDDDTDVDETRSTDGVALSMNEMLLHRHVKGVHGPFLAWGTELDPDRGTNLPEKPALRPRGNSRPTGDAQEAPKRAYQPRPRASVESKAERPKLPQQSATAYRAMRKGEQAQGLLGLKRQVQSLLNKIAPENLTTISIQLATITITSAAELQFVISIIFTKALQEPHYVSTYADMMTVLRTCYPEFPDEDGVRPKTFTRLLLGTVQSEYESLPKTLDPTEDQKEMFLDDPEGLAMQTLRIKKKVLANMKLIGHLYLRQLLSVKIIQAVARELLFCEDRAGEDPEEHFLECMCELITTIGFTVDSTDSGRAFMTNCVGRLTDLRRSAKYSKRTQLLLLDVLELRAADWRRKVYKETATTVSEVHKMAKSKQGKEAFTIQIAGARPANLKELTEFQKIEKPPEPAPIAEEKPKTSDDGKGFGQDLCRAYSMGKCGRGAKCRFVHDPTQRTVDAAPRSAPPRRGMSDRVPMRSKPEPPQNRQPSPETAEIDEGKVKRIVGYYEDDKDDTALASDWKGLGLNPLQTQTAVTFLMKRGFSEPPSRSASVATAISVLVRLQAVPTRTVEQALQQCVGVLEDILMDNPGGAEFFTALADRCYDDKGTWAFGVGKLPQFDLLARSLSAEVLDAVRSA